MDLDLFKRTVHGTRLVLDKLHEDKAEATRMIHAYCLLVNYGFEELPDGDVRISWTDETGPHQIVNHPMEFMDNLERNRE